MLGIAFVWFETHMTSPMVNPISSPSTSELSVVVNFSTDASIADALDTLMYYGVVDEPILWRLRIGQRGVRGRVVAGSYYLSLSMTPDEVIDRLIRSPDAGSGPVRLRIIPGDTIWKVGERLDELGATTDLLQLDRDTRKFARLGVKVPARSSKAFTRLEGYLAPDTYFLNRDEVTAAAAVKVAIRQHYKRWHQLVSTHRASYDRLRKKYRLTDQDFLILASLVEKEVAHLPEAPLIAQVFYNRLQKKMKLQTDPTMVYGPSTWRERPSPTFRRNTRNPYNTYAHAGLPPGPICSPGPQAIEAVLNPRATNALFFAAMRDGTGRHAFAESLDEHRANIQRYLKQK
jgi:UPF0755 protein